MNILVTLNSGMGTGLGPNFNVYGDVGSVVYNVTLSQLLAGIELTFDDSAVYVVIESIGVCPNILYIPISGTTTTTTTVPFVPCVEYGLIYNRYVINDARNITSSNDWRIPTIGDFLSLISYHGDSATTANAIKITGTTYWDAPNLYATNSFQFNAVGAGYRNVVSDFVNKNIVNVILLDDFLDRAVFLSSSSQFISYSVNDNGSIRLIRDGATTLSHGEEGRYTGNDGTVYRTICIGTQEWLADNLMETQFRNNDDIPIVENLSIWNALSSSAMCAYDNDFNNVGCGFSYTTTTTTTLPCVELNYSIDAVEAATTTTTSTTSGASPFIFEVSVGAGYELELPLHSGYTYDGYVDWGDGSPTTTLTSYDDVNRLHTYSTADNYIVKIYGTCQAFATDGYKTIRDVIIRVVAWGFDADFRKLNFYDSPNFLDVPDLITSADNIETLESLFDTCPLFTTIPSNLFNNLSNVTDCTYLCYENGITSIPSGLFDNCPLINSFAEAFKDCLGLTSIPSGLFDNNTIAGQTGVFSGFESTFSGCENLTSVPTLLFKYNTVCTNFQNTFFSCHKLALNRNIFYDDGDINTRFLNQSVDFTNTFNISPGYLGAGVGEAPELWACDYGTGTPNSTYTFLGQSLSSVSNYGSIPIGWQ